MEEASGWAVERNVLLWQTNVSRGVNHFQSQMVAVLYVIIMPDIGFDAAQLGIVTAVVSLLNGTIQGFYGFALLFNARDDAHGHRQLGAGIEDHGHGFRGLHGWIPGDLWSGSSAANAQHSVGYSMLAGYFLATRGEIIALSSSISNMGSLPATITAGAMLLIMDWRQVFMSVAMGLVDFVFRGAGRLL